MSHMILTRSGTTDFDEQERLTGTLDVPINGRGQEELARMAEELRGFPVEMIYAAAGSAARESAEFLGRELQVKVKVLDDLHNLDFGRWQGLPLGELRKKHRKVFKYWEETPCAVCPPDGEMLPSVRDRVQKALRPVLKKAQSGMVVLVAPEPLRSVIRCYLKGENLDQLWDAGNPNGCWETIVVAGTE